MGRSATDILAANGIDELSDDHLEHVGVKGMRWGRRKRAKAEAAAAEAAKPKVHEMSDDELKKRINRLKLEKEYKKLTEPEISNGRKIVGELLLDVGKQKAKAYLMNNATDDLRALKKMMAKQAVAAAAPPAARQVMKLTKYTGPLK
jgi:hypothetical protein